MTNHLLEVKALIDTQPVAKRVELYRWLASVAHDRDVAKRLNCLASQLEATENLCHEFDFVFSQKGGGK